MEGKIETGNLRLKTFMSLPPPILPSPQQDIGGPCQSKMEGPLPDFLFFFYGLLSGGPRPSFDERGDIVAVA